MNQQSNKRALIKSKASKQVSCQTMGVGAVLVTMFVMILGAGYLLLGTPEGSFTVENPGVNEQGTVNNEQGIGSGVQEPAGRLAIGMSALEKAKDIKAMAEERAEETMEEAGDTKQVTRDAELETGTAKQETENKEEVPKPAISHPQPEIKNRLVSFGHRKSSGRTIDTIILHSSYNNQGGDKYSVERVIDIWESYDVAPHYLIDREGNILRLVEDQHIAYHAGNSKVPDGRTDVNGFSIGIELFNAMDDEYTDAQYDAINGLVAYLKGKYKIKYVLGHDDIAPGRKTDPWNFDWKRLK